MQNARLTILALLFILSLSFTANAQWNKWGKGISGEGPKVTRTLNLDDITGIGVAIGARVHLKQGNRQEVTIKAQQNIIDLLDRDVRRGHWDIGLEDNVNLKRHDGIDVYITIPTVKKLSIAGSGSIRGKNAFKDINDLSVSIAGAGSIELEGNGADLDVSIAGSGDVELSDFIAQNCEVSIAGSGDCEINVAERLDVSIAGSGDVKYKGDPDKVKSSIAGSGNVRSF